MNDLQGSRKTGMRSWKFAEEFLFAIIRLEGQRKREEKLAQRAIFGKK